MLDAKLRHVYDNGLDLASWGEANAPDERLIYRNGVDSQLRKIAAVATLLHDFGAYDLPPLVVGSHTSKSVKLPVTCFRFAPYEQVEAYVFVRDNFHNIKAVVVSDSPIHMPYHVVHMEWSPERYEEELKRYSKYHENDTPEEAQKRRVLMATDDWFKDWSSGVLLRKDGRIYRTGSYQSVYCEGIDTPLMAENAVFKPYEDGDKSFVCEVDSYTIVARILEHVIDSLERERYKRNQESSDA